jgi:putative peptide zinc metalloprotease protein
MTEALFSSYWYRVKALQPNLRGHIQISRQNIRGQAWYVLHDGSSRRTFRFSEAAYHAVALMDGKRTVARLWDECNSILGDDAPTQEQLIQLLGQLHASDVLQCDVSPDAQELLHRYQKQRKSDRQGRWKSSLSLKIPLFNPDRLLDRALPWTAPLFSRAGLGVWLVSILAGMVLAAQHWPELTDNVFDRLTTPQNIALFWLIYPAVKIVHEFGHAITAKRYGGEVAETGVMVIAFLPIPYVDVSSTNAFVDKRERMTVATAGIMVDLFTAALALFLWLLVEPGLVRTAAFDVMTIGGLSSLFFNGNPLLRYDGYYILADAIEIPNLSARSGQYLSYLAKRHLFGLTDAPSPVTGDGEAKWLLGYGVVSWLYRNLMLALLLLFVIHKYYTLGILLASVAVTTQLAIPLARMLLFPFISSTLVFKRMRAVGIALGLALTLAVLLFVVPIPSWTTTEGVVWLSDDAIIRAKTSGIVRTVLVPAGHAVSPGNPLIALDDPFLRVELRALEARTAELGARANALWMSNQVEANIVMDELKTAQADLRRAEERINDLTLRSPVSGTILIPDSQDLPGRFVRQGDALAYLIEGQAKLRIKAMIPQEKISLVQRTKSIEIKLAGRPGRTFTAISVRQVPQATDQLPSPVLGTAGGGSLAVDPTKSEGTTLLEKQFELELELVQPIEPIRIGIGRRVYVRFEHESETLATQASRALRQLFMRQIDV